MLAILVSNSTLVFYNVTMKRWSGVRSGYCRHIAPSVVARFIGVFMLVFLFLFSTVYLSVMGTWMGVCMWGLMTGLRRISSHENLVLSRG